MAAARWWADAWGVDIALPPSIAGKKERAGVQVGWEISGYLPAQPMVAAYADNHRQGLNRG